MTFAQETGLTAEPPDVVPQFEAAGHSRGAERAVGAFLIGQDQPAVHLPVSPETA